MRVRDDASLRRLAEMGVDVYLPRGIAMSPSIAATLIPVCAKSDGVAQGSAREAARIVDDRFAAPDTIDVILLADMQAAAAKPLIADIARALRFARVGCAQTSVADAAAVAEAAALVMFGDAQMRAAGALLPAQRQGEIGWVVSGEPSTLAGDAPAKRALWSELKRMTRRLTDARRVR